MLIGTKNCKTAPLQQTEFSKRCWILIQAREQLQDSINVLAERVRDISRPCGGAQSDPKCDPREKRSNVIEFLDSEAAKVADMTASVQQLIDSLDI